jgi:dienelactone hydrolase
MISVGAGLSLPVPTSAGQQKGRPGNPPLPPPNSGPPGPSKEPTGPITCPGLRECTPAENELPKELRVAFPGPDGMTLHGHLYVPGVRTEAELAALSKAPRARASDPNARVAGTGGLRAVVHTFPAIIYNHGSDPTPDGEPTIARIYVDNGYIFFAPDRHGQGLSKDAGPYHVDEQKKLDKEDPNFGMKVVQLHEKYNRDVIAAVEWFKQQPYVDSNRIVMTGLSFGGIQTLMAAEKDPGMRAYIPFAPAAMSWGLPALDDKLAAIVTNDRVPMFIIQAQGDYSLGPIETLGPLLQGKGDPGKWKSKLYPQFGCTNDDAHRRFAKNCDGIAIWKSDVLKFIEQILK